MAIRQTERHDRDVTLYEEQEESKHAEQHQIQQEQTAFAKSASHLQQESRNREIAEQLVQLHGMAGHAVRSCSDVCRSRSTGVSWECRNPFRPTDDPDNYA